MNFLLASGVEIPSGLWSTLINWFQGGIGNFGWTIFLLTILVKLVTSPLDFWTKLNTKKQNLIQQKCSPQISKIKKKFGANAQAVKTQTDALYKKEGLNAGTSCIVMLINLVLTLVIFFTFYSSLRANSAYQAINQYEILESTYNETSLSFIISKNDEILEYEITDEESANVFWTDYFKGKSLSEGTDSTNSEETDGTEPTMTDEEYIEIYEKYKSIVDETIAQAESSVVEKWHEIKSSWLWINNIWVKDSTISPFLTYSSLRSIASSGGNNYLTYVDENISEENFTLISNIINEQGGRTNNGFYILAILAGVITFLSQFIAERHNNSLKNKKANQLANSLSDSMNTSMKFMKFIMPVIMIIFVLQSSASFGIYIVASNISSIAFGEISNLIIHKITYKQQKEVEDVLEKEANRLLKKGKLYENKEKK